MYAMPPNIEYVSTHLEDMSADVKPSMRN